VTTVRSDWYIPPATIDDAARKAERCFPGIIGEVLSREIMSLGEFTFLGEGSRPARLLAAVQGLPEPVAERWTQ
jgi:hypothetical protein